MGSSLPEHIPAPDERDVDRGGSSYMEAYLQTASEPLQYTR